MFVSHVNFDDLDEDFDPELKEFIQTNCTGSALEEILERHWKYGN